MTPINSITPELTADWDLQLGSDGSLKMLSGAAGIAQNVACACRCFQGGCYFYQSYGIAWFNDALAKKFQRTLIASRIMETSLAVQGVAEVKSVTIDGLDSESRIVTGDVQIVTEEGENVAARI